MSGYKNSFLLVAFFLFSCTNPVRKSPETLPYFSLKNYFETEATRLSESDPYLLKVVKRNDEKEEKKLKINDWKKEFSLFIESDINKPSWKDSYQVIKSKDTLSFLSKDPALKTQRIQVIEQNGEIRGILIHNLVKNDLYSSEEKLHYFPDSLYHIEKVQHVRFLGDNHYQVSGYLK